MKAVILSNGNIHNYESAKKWCTDRFVICADGAVRHAVSIGADINLWVGDKDSCVLDDATFAELTKNCEIIYLNPQKDMTDTEFACDCAIKRGFKDVVLLGSTGKRIDHEIANIYMLKRFKDAGIGAKIVNENSIVYMADKHNIIENEDFDYVSLIPLSDEISGVSNTGFYYSLNNSKIDKYSSVGVSNKMVANVATIDIECGEALIILSKD